MNFISIPLLCLVMGILFWGIKKDVLKKEEAMDEENFIVHQSRIVFWLGIVCALIMVMFMIFLGLSQSPPWFFYLMWSGFIILPLFLSISCIYWKIEITGNNICFTSFKKLKTFRFEDITVIKLDYQNAIRAYSGKRKCFKVEKISVGYNVLLARLQKENIPIVEIGYSAHH